MSNSGGEHIVWFERLIPLLKENKLSCENGSLRHAEPDEFMFMNVDPENKERAFFKHRDTRNYLIVKLKSNGNGYELEVPMTDQAFMLGFFDCFDVINVKNPPLRK